MEQERELWTAVQRPGWAYPSMLFWWPCTRISLKTGIEDEKKWTEIPGSLSLTWVLENFIGTNVGWCYINNIVSQVRFGLYTQYVSRRVLCCFFFNKRTIDLTRKLQNALFLSSVCGSHYMWVGHLGQKTLKKTDCIKIHESELLETLLHIQVVVLETGCITHCSVLKEHWNLLKEHWSLPKEHWRGKS